MKQKQRKLVRQLAAFDVLSDVLGTLGLRSRLFCRSELVAPWAMAFPAGNLAHFHIVERGGAWVELEGSSDNGSDGCRKAEEGFWLSGYAGRRYGWHGWDGLLSSVRP